MAKAKRALQVSARRGLVLKEFDAMNISQCRNGNEEPDTGLKDSCFEVVVFQLGLTFGSGLILCGWVRCVTPTVTPTRDPFF